MIIRITNNDNNNMNNDFNDNNEYLLRGVFIVRRERKKKV